MKPDMVKKEYRLQEWSGMLQSQKQSGLTVKQWCEEHGIRENAYYYRLRKVREVVSSRKKRRKRHKKGLSRSIYDFESPFYLYSIGV